MSKSRFKKGQTIYRVETFCGTNNRKECLYKLSIVAYTVESCGAVRLTLAEDNADAYAFNKQFVPTEVIVGHWFENGEVKTIRNTALSPKNLVFHADMDSAMDAAQWVIENACGLHPNGIYYGYYF